MMDCARCKELIFTDYVDGQLDVENQEEVTRHIKECASCRALEASLRKEAIEPLKHAERVTPPESVWQNIRERIVAREEVRESVFSRLVEALRNIFTIPKPVWAAAAVAVLVFALLFVRAPSVTRGPAAVTPLAAVSEQYIAGEDELNDPAISIDAGFGTASELFLM